MNLRRPFMTVMAALTLAACDAGMKSAEDLKRVVGTLSSLAQESAFLVEELQKSDLTHAYAKIHREKLAEEVDDAAKKLRGDIAAPLASRAERARALAEDLARVLRDLAGHLEDAGTVRQARAELARVARELAKLEGAS
jgi:hypothetical protein